MEMTWEDQMSNRKTELQREKIKFVRPLAGTFLHFAYENTRN